MPSKLILQSIPSAPPPFDPNSVAGIYGWWSATDSVVVAPGGVVSSVSDLSPNGRDLVAGTAAPTLVSVSPSVDAFEFTAVQSLTRASQNLTTNKMTVVACVGYPKASRAPYSENYTMATIIEFAGALETVFGIFGSLGGFGGAVSDNTLAFVGNFNNQTTDFRSTAATGLTRASNENQTVVCSTRADRSNNQGEVGLDGTMLSNTVTGTSNLSVNGDLFIGGAYNSMRYCGRIFEVIVYDDYLSDIDYANVQTYLLNKYGV